MKLLSQKNTLWKLYSHLVLLVLFYFLSSIFGITNLDWSVGAFLLLYVFIMLFSQWNAIIEITFADEYLLVNFYLQSRIHRCNYSEIIMARDVFLKFYGNRIIFKCQDTNGKILKFVLYNPKKEIVDLLKIKTSRYREIV